MGRRFSAVSLFTGAGGLDIGLERAGFQTVVATDIDQHCIATLRANQSRRIRVAGRSSRTHLEGARIVQRAVEDLGAADLRPRGVRAGWRPDLLVGGPPCQPFSAAGRQLSVKDPRGTLFQEFVRLAGEIRPRLILFENVRGLVTARGERGIPGEVVDLVRAQFEEIGYATAFAVLNSADFGAPQRRVRLFMVGAAPGCELPHFPEPTHTRQGGATATALKPWVSLGEFLDGRAAPPESEVVRPSPRFEPALASLTPGTGLRSPGRSEPTRPGGHWGYKQGMFVADPALPARTVTGASTQDWIRDADGRLRRLTLGEAAALQGFPPEWVFEGPRARQFLQVGNAVPAQFGEVIGREITRALSAAAPDARQERSRPLPSDMVAAVAYVRRDDARNGHVRPRSPNFAGPARAW